MFEASFRRILPIVRSAPPISLVAMLSAAACVSDAPLQVGSPDADAEQMTPEDVEPDTGTNVEGVDPLHNSDPSFFNPGPGVDHAARYPDLLDQLESEAGLPGFMHAVVPERQLAVFTWRQPGNFFEFVDFPVIPSDQEVQQQVMSLQRHDAVVLRGTFSANRAPLTHIRADDVELTQPYETEHSARAYEYGTKLPEELLANTELVGKVHASLGEGILVIEVGDAVVPVFSRDPNQTVNLFRNDKIRVRYRISSFPGSPEHMWLDDEEQEAIEVLDSMQDKHNTAATLEGVLALYPQSPQIVRDVYACQVSVGDGVTREFTLVNQDDPEIFIEIQDKAAAAWLAEEAEPVNGRNKLIKPELHCTVSGMLNVIDANQANPQILMEGPDALTIEAQP